MQFVDLHTHSTASDGTLAPGEVVRLAKQSGLSALALTDHDTIAGVEEASRVAREVAIDFLPGIEISCKYPRPGTMHLLGYGINPSSASLAQATTSLVDARNHRNREMVAKLSAMGIPITIEEVQATAGGEVVGRPHIASVLVKRGIVSNFGQAFGEYIGAGAKAWVDKEHLSPREAIAMIHDAGGLAVLAHAVHLRKTNNAQLRAEIKNLADLGLDGVECIHSEHRESLIDLLCDIASDYGLLCTGGSDFHGGNKPHIKLGCVGALRIPRKLYDDLIARLNRR